MSPSLATRVSSNAYSLRSPTPLSDDQIRRVAPSIFAQAPHASRSARYAQIPTAQVLGALRREGFEPFKACQCRTRLPDRHAFTKHLLRLRHRSAIAKAEAYEIVLVNSHDASSSYVRVGDDEGRETAAPLPSTIVFVVLVEAGAVRAPATASFPVPCHCGSINVPFARERPP